VNPLRSLIDRFAAWNKKPVDHSAEEVTQLLEAIASGLASDGQIDAFIYIPILDPELDQIRRDFADLYVRDFDPKGPAFLALISRAQGLRPSSRPDLT
jgi:hypothetical protein